MKDVVWTIMLAIVLLLTVAVSRHGLLGVGAEDQQVADLHTTAAVPATGNQAPESQTIVKSETEQHAGEKQNLAVSTAVKHASVKSTGNQSISGVQGVSEQSAPSPEAKNQEPAKSFLAQATPENLNRLKQAQEEKALSVWGDHGSPPEGANEVDTVDLFNRLQGITESR